MKTSGLRAVPQDATFIHRGVPLARRDCYSVSEARSCELGDELITVEGIIFDRLHCEPQFPSEQRSVETAGYGVPGESSSQGRNNI
uniref:Uncharacterized protein n=1 Tax=Timema poppense TaxID=170557 RepID=A0A7R9HH58_TIMPO|nr:unnamed protein product [Timema poppensis]